MVTIYFFAMHFYFSESSISVSYLNPTKELFSAWWWKVYERNSFTRENLFLAMELACGEIGVECGVIVRLHPAHPKVFLLCLARDKVACESLIDFHFVVAQHF